MIALTTIALTMIAQTIIAPTTIALTMSALQCMHNNEANEHQEMLGQINIELSNYVYKVFEEATLPLVGGRISNGQLRVKISVVSIPDAPKIGVDPAHLLDSVPGHMR